MKVTACFIYEGATTNDATNARMNNDYYCFRGKQDHSSIFAITNGRFLCFHFLRFILNLSLVFYLTHTSLIFSALFNGLLLVPLYKEVKERKSYDGC